MFSSIISAGPLSNIDLRMEVMANILYHSTELINCMINYGFQTISNTYMIMSEWRHILFNI